MIFILFFVYSFLFLIGSTRKNGNVLNIITLVLNIILVLGVIGVVFISVKDPLRIVSNIANNETKVIITDNLGLFLLRSWWLYGLWKIVLLVYAIVPVARIYGFSAQLLPHLYVSKFLYITSASLFGVLYLFSSIVFIQATEGIGYNLIELSAFIMFIATSYRIFRADIFDMEFKIQDLEKEKI